MNINLYYFHLQAAMLKELEKENAADQHRLVLLFCASSEFKMNFKVNIQKCPLITIPPSKFCAQDLKVCLHKTKFSLSPIFPPIYILYYRLKFWCKWVCHPFSPINGQKLRVSKKKVSVQVSATGKISKCK